MRESLEAYVKANPEQEGTDCIQKLRDSHHYECLKAVYDVFLAPHERKSHLVWIWGSANTGKSTFIEALEEIFSCQKISFNNNLINEEPSNNLQVKTQIALCTEFNHETALSDGTYSTLKQLLEGKGGQVKGNLWEKWGSKYKDVFFLFASNSIHYSSNKDKFPSQWKNKWEPIEKRGQIIELTQQFEEGTPPYDSKILAHALYQMVQQNEGEYQCIVPKLHTSKNLVNHES